MTADRRELVRHVGLPAVLVPLLIALALCAFAWPAARLAPRELPVGVVGSAPIGPALEAGDAFDGQHYADDAAARNAIEDRDVYGAFESGTDGLTVLVASAASPTVAQQLSAVAAASGAATKTVDVVPLSAEDPHGVVLAGAVLPLVFGGEIIAVFVALLVGVRPAARQLGALVVTSVTTAALAYAVAQVWLGALPHDGVATFGALTLLLLAIAATTAGLFALLGVRGIGLAAATMIFLGNPFSGATSAPELLPAPANWLGQLLPPGAGAQLVRSTAYFDGHGALAPTLVLLAWIVAGGAGVVIGHRRLAHGHHEQPARHAVPEPVG